MSFKDKLERWSKDFSHDLSCSIWQFYGQTALKTDTRASGPGEAHKQNLTQTHFIYSSTQTDTAISPNQTDFKRGYTRCPWSKRAPVPPSFKLRYNWSFSMNIACLSFMHSRRIRHYSTAVWYPRWIRQLASSSFKLASWDLDQWNLRNLRLLLILCYLIANGWPMLPVLCRIEGLLAACE